MGFITTASGSYSTAMGNGTTAVGNSSTAMGIFTHASGNSSTAMGIGTNASGNASTAMGLSNTASGVTSTAMGESTTASGSHSTAMGFITSAKSYAETSVGSYNTSYTPESAVSFHAADRAFGVGIGIATGTNAKDGLIVYKSGNTYINNTTSATPTGTESIIPTIGAGALQVRATGDGFNLVTGTGNNSMNIAKAGSPGSGISYVSFGHLGSGSYTEIGSIRATGSPGISFNTSSDYRLKIDNGTYNKGLNTINQIKIHDYTWKESKTKDIGVFAQELFKIYPNAVSKGDDESVSNPSDIKKVWQVDYSKLVPVLVAAVQELTNKNEALEQKIADIENQKALLTAQVKEMASLKAEIEIIKATIGLKATSSN